LQHPSRAPCCVLELPAMPVTSLTVLSAVLLSRHLWQPMVPFPRCRRPSSSFGSCRYGKWRVGCCCHALTCMLPAARCKETGASHHCSVVSEFSAVSAACYACQLIWKLAGLFISVSTSSSAAFSCISSWIKGTGSVAVDRSQTIPWLPH